MEMLDKIGYTRVSTKDQDPENQIRLLQSSGIPPDYVFVDKGISGTIPAENRPGFQRAMKYISEHPNEVKYLYVFELSRLGRNFFETVSLLERLEKQGIMVWSLSPAEAFIRSSDAGIRQLLIALLLWVAQRERENLIERTKAGIDRARSEGKLIGRPRADIDFERVKILRIEGKPWEDIANEIGYPVMTLYRARKRRGEI